MDYLSTTALSNILDIKSKELFEKLNSLGWIERKNDKWILTSLGKEKGGQTRKNPKYGEFIVWPENISFDKGQHKEKFLNATSIGKHFNISSQRLNLILSIFNNSVAQASTVAPVVIISSTNKICFPFNDELLLIAKTAPSSFHLDSLPLNTFVFVDLVFIRTLSL